MKQFRLSLAVTALTLSLSAFAFAGQMPGGVIQPAPTPPQNSTAGQMPGGVTVTSDAISQTVAIDAVSEIGLNLIQSALSLF